MANIKAFKGVRYNKQVVGDLNDVMAPPYDVIPDDLRDELYNKSEFGSIRLILGKEYDTDSDADNRYTRAKSDLDSFMDKNAMVRDEKPAIYYKEQEYTGADGTKKTRKGFIVRVELEEFGKGRIYPHEKTLSGPKKDRLAIMKLCKGNLSSIFGIYGKSDSNNPTDIKGLLKEAATKLGEPQIDVVGVQDDVPTKLWVVTDTDVIAKVTDAMKDRSLYIADGHHRYETALNYRNFRREEAGSFDGTEDFNFIMMYLTGMEDEGLDVFPTHRVVHSFKDFDLDRLLTDAKEYFDIEIEADEKEFVEKLETGSKKTSFGLKAIGDDKFYILRLKNLEIMDGLFGDKLPKVYKSLDVVVLHSLLLNKVLGISNEDQEKQTYLKYVKGTEPALEETKNTANTAVFFMNPTSVADVEAVSDAGLLMPQKSTFFYPKLLSGVVYNIMD